MRQFWRVVALALSAALLAGCGSTTSSTSTPNATASVSQTPPTPTEEASTTATTSSNTAAAPDASGPPAFTTEGSTENGDKLRIEGRFGPILPASESDVDQTVLAQCPRYDNRELVTRLDLTTTIESGLAGDVRIGGFIPPLSEVSHLMDYVLDLRQGSTCELAAVESNIATDLGTLQPHEPQKFTMWVVLLDAITPSDPRPSLQTLAHQNWIMGGPEASVAGASVRVRGGAGAIRLVK